MKILSADIDGAAVGQMSAMGQVHAQHGIAGVEHGKIDGGVCLRAAMGLHVGMLGPKKQLGAVACQVFCHVHVLAAAIIPLGRIPLRVFVGQGRSHGLHHGGRNEVFRGNQLNVLALTLYLVRNRLEKFGVGFHHMPVVHLCSPLIKHESKKPGTLRQSDPAAHPKLRLLLLPSGPDRVHALKSHRTQPSSCTRLSYFT